MALRFRDLPVKEYGKLVLPFLAVVGIGIVLRGWYPCNWWPHDVMPVLADALIVAGVIGVVLELFAAKFLIERVADDLAQKLVGRGLPPELQAHIRTIVETDFVRDHYVKSYRLSDPDETGHVRLDIKVTFEVRNHSDSVREFAPEAAEETFYYPEFQHLEYGIVGRPMHSFDAGQLSSIVQTIPDTNVKFVAGPRKVKLDPIKRNDKAICRVIWWLRVTMPAEYSEVTNFGGATIGATLQLERVPEGFEFISSGENMRHESSSRSWDFAGPFVKGQHVAVWWFVRRRAHQRGHRGSSLNLDTN